jgi:hypothetical protein
VVGAAVGAAVGGFVVGAVVGGRVVEVGAGVGAALRAPTATSSNDADANWVTSPIRPSLSRLVEPVPTRLPST